MKKLIRSAILLCAFLLPAFAFAQYEGEYYIMHASGLHLAKTTSSSVLRSATTANPEKLIIVSTSDGYYNIKAQDGTFLAQNGGNEWNTGFIANGGGDVAKFSFEKSDNFLKIKNKHTGKYLGVDEVKDGNWVFCDKSGTSTTHLWFLSDDVNASVPGSSYYMLVNPAAQRQVFDGWGVSLCWWAHMCGSWSQEKLDEIIEWLVSPEYLNYSHFRYNIGGGDDPEHRNCDEHHMANGKGIRAEMPGFKAYEDSEYDWDADSAQIRIMRMIKEKRPDAVFEAFSNSAPYWMTYSGCTSGNKSSSKDNLKPEYYEKFADYLIDVLKHFKEVEGIEFSSLEPFNEPMTNYWYANGGQEGCHFDVNSQIAFLKVLYPKLQASGLNTVISCSDETNVWQQVQDIQAFKSADVMKYIGQVNTHTYVGSIKDCANLSALATDAGLPIWMSEVGSSGDGIQGNLLMAKHLISDMRYYEPNVWCDWQYVEEGYDQWCFIQAGFSSQKYRRVNNFYVRQHLSKYINGGYTILTSTNDNTLVARNPEGTELVIVCVNPEALACDFKIDLGLYKSISHPTTAAYSTSGSYFNPQEYSLADSYLSFKLSGLSIATFVVPVEEEPALDAALADGGKYLLMPRLNSGAAVTARDNKVSLQEVDLSNDQVWTASLSGNKATFTNGNGNKITATSDYALSYTSAASGTQEFTLTPVGQGYYKIEANGKAFDLESENWTINTGVGMWDYGTSPAAAHRHFRLVPLMDRNSITPEGGDDPENPDGIAAVNADKALISAQRGIINVANAKGTVAVYTLDGRLVCKRTVANSISIPVAKGIYIISTPTARKVISVN